MEDQARGDASCTYEQFVLYHEAQLRKSGVPELYWPALSRKLQNDVWDLGSRVTVNRVLLEASEDTTVDGDIAVREGEEDLPFPIVLCGPAGISMTEPDSIFLVDHAWTFDIISARPMLRSYPALLERMCDIMDIDRSPLSEEPSTASGKEEIRERLIEAVLQNMWKFVNTYSFSSSLLSAEDKLPRWYMHDEIGSRIAHADESNCRLIPFYYVQGQITYSLLFPLCDIEDGQELTRNFIEGLASAGQDEAYRQCRLLPWREVQLPADTSYDPRAVPLDYFRNSALADSLPAPNNAKASSTRIESPKLSSPAKVFSEYEVLTTFLTDERFQIVDSPADADILWYSRHFNDYRGLVEEFPDKLINQFPYESVVTVKDLLAIICRRTVADGQPLIDPQTLNSSPPWLAATYNLESDLVNFVAYFLERQKRGMNNLWICKPWNLARSLDMIITDNLSAIVRLPETGPKLCCKYIENPILFHRADVPGGPVKFDLRFIVLLHSVAPLRLAMYQHFWLRFANQPFALSDYDIYDKHFTVMNYGQGPIHQMFCHDFVRHFEEQNSAQSWAEVEKEVYRIVRQVFEAATSQAPPAGLAPSPQSRAIYGLDFMLKWNTSGDRPAVQPVLLEINYSPDCKRACDYYPDFFNHVLRYLVLNEKPQTIIEL
ncbi:hypothetical protein RvY_18149 [Ramazzottius varieornatus]|uniref:Tubulin--tyrosine ligase-like protein 12 SET-like domain-containing protein n=1 Tax=Ramazzottius varieornatus TaxID=947166 RepID=A0A1D1W599_RAMVA|nr:hypothetical protein RvY_18149 [Ramazzottius varieornatus]